ncbi:MAG: efflux RND transporter periplasmic adaptor subunit [Lachnospiraceae bacterium]|jgi:HlyD family secretion protein|nr:efflux RND transporter periplasmic adaptor subunit [Lachnospiraceae bacterium]
MSNSTGSGKKHKKLIITMVVILILAVVAGGVYWFLVKGKKSESKNTAGGGHDFDSGNADLIASAIFTGVVEPEQSNDIKLDSDRQLDKILVQKGDSVKAGQQLFTYKTADLSLQIEQSKLELSAFNDSVTDLQNQVSSLEAEKSKATDDASKLEYSSQIQDLTTQLKQAELNVKTKQAEIDSLNKKISSSIVTSPIDGIITNINASNNSSDGTAFMTILSSNAYRVKGTVDELNISMLAAGTPVTFRSRINDKKWTGKITKVDTESTVQNNNQMMGYSDNSNTQQASKYNFYASIDTPDGLMIGQHLYVELSTDNTTDNSTKDTTTNDTNDTNTKNTTKPEG